MGSKGAVPESDAAFHGVAEGLTCKNETKRRSKERMVWHFLNYVYPEIKWVHDKPIPGSKSQKRPDICTLVNDAFVLVIEVDEFQHKLDCNRKFYEDGREMQRIKAIRKDCGKWPLVMIRFNPDFYKDFNGTDKVQQGVLWHSRSWDVRELSERMALLAHEVDAVLQAGPSGDLQVKRLFFDGYDRESHLAKIDACRVRACSEVASQLCASNFPLHQVRHEPARNVFKYTPERARNVEANIRVGLLMLKYGKVPEKYQKYLELKAPEAEAEAAAEQTMETCTTSVPHYDTVEPVASESAFDELLQTSIKRKCSVATVRCLRYVFDAMFVNEEVAFGHIRDPHVLYDEHVKVTLTVQNRSKIKMYMEVCKPKMAAFHGKVKELWHRWYLCSKELNVVNDFILPQLRTCMHVMYPWNDLNPEKVAEIQKIASMLGVDKLAHLDHIVPRSNFITAAKYMASNAGMLSNLFGFRHRVLWLDRAPTSCLLSRDESDDIVESVRFVTWGADTQSEKQKRGRPRKQTQMAIKYSRTDDENVIRRGMSVINHILKIWTWGLFTMTVGDTERCRYVNEHGKKVYVRTSDFKITYNDKHMDEHMAGSLIHYLSS